MVQMMCWIVIDRRDGKLSGDDGRPTDDKDVGNDDDGDSHSGQTKVMVPLIISLIVNGRRGGKLSDMMLKLSGDDGKSTDDKNVHDDDDDSHGGQTK
ncbi:hypothetical protein ElyMa_005723400, partial [Elysia marginata]